MNQVKREANRRISFLIAAKSYQLKAVGTMAKCQLSIPVIRPQDCLTKGSGKIFIDFESNPLKIIGKNTKFTTECMVKGLIALPQSLGASEVAEIISDTELLIRKEFKNLEKSKNYYPKAHPSSVLTKLTKSKSIKWSLIIWQMRAVLVFS